MVVGVCPSDSPGCQRTAVKSTQPGKREWGQTRVEGQMTSPTLHARCPDLGAAPSCSVARRHRFSPSDSANQEPGGPPTQPVPGTDPSFLRSVSEQAMPCSPRPSQWRRRRRWMQRKRGSRCARSGRGGDSHRVMAGNSRLCAYMSRQARPNSGPLAALADAIERICFARRWETGGAAIANDRHQLWLHLRRRNAVVVRSRTDRFAIQRAGRRCSPSRWVSPREVQRRCSP